MAGQRITTQVLGLVGFSLELEDHIIITIINVFIIITIKDFGSELVPRLNHSDENILGCPKIGVQKLLQKLITW